MKHKTLAVGIVFLFVITSITPMVIGFDAETKDVDVELEAELANLRYLCTTPDGFDEIKYNYYKENLVNDYSDDDLDVVITVEPLDVEIQGALPVPLDGPMDSPWSMQSHDTHHTGRSQYQTGHNTDGLEKWRFLLNHWVEISPIIDNDGIIYTADTWGNIYALYPDMVIKWRFTTGGQILGSTPAIDEDGIIYVGSWDDYLYAINPNGTEKWRFYAEDTIASSPAIASDGTIYFGTMGPGYNIFAVNPDGSEKWRYPTGYNVNSDPAIGDDGTIYIGSGDDYLYALYPNGSLKWRFKTGDILKGSISIASDGTVYVGSFDGYLYAVYHENGTMKWRHPVGYGTETNPSIASDGTVYVGGWEYLWAIYPDGILRWAFYLGDEKHIHQSSPAISAEGIIYVGVNIGETEGGEILAVNPDGSERWRKFISGFWVESSPSIGEDGTVYIGSANAMGSGYLHAFGDIESNAPPDTPTIDGSLEGEFGEEYEYTFCAIDSDRNPVSFFIDWDEGSDPSWSRDYASGENVKISHTWDEEGTYTIGVKSRDTLGEESDWAYLEVSMPVNQHVYSFPFLQRLFERFPNAFPILRQLSGL